MICKSCSWKLAPSFICTVLFQGAPDADLIFGSGKRAPPKWWDNCCLCLSRIYHHHQFVEPFVRHQWYRLSTDQCCRDISFSGGPLWEIETAWELHFVELVSLLWWAWMRQSVLYAGARHLWEKPSVVRPAFIGESILDILPLQRTLNWLFKVSL